jgi:hypothetical protein
VVLGASALEESTGVSGQRLTGGAALWALLFALGIAGAPGGAGAVGEDPATEVTEALRSQGPPGLVWGRLAIEEESPVGAWTPLSGIEVTLYPATPTLITELERIRQSARTSATQYESAVARVQAALAVHQGQIDRQTAPALLPGQGLVAEPPLLVRRATKPRASAGGGFFRPSAVTAPSGAPGGAAGSTSAALEPGETSHAWRQKTDPAGLFAFATVPSGDWVVVAIRIAPYSAEKLRAEPKPKQSSRTQSFLPRVAGAPREVELWVTRVRVVAGARVALHLTDRARWLVGPLR